VKRVVVAGMGVVSPLGNTVHDFLRGFAPRSVRHRGLALGPLDTTHAITLTTKKPTG